MPIQYKKVLLSEKEIANALKAAKRYLELINKELSYTDLVNVENVTYYTECYKDQHSLARNGYVLIPISGD